MTSLRKRFEGGDFSQIDFWMTHQGEVPICCCVFSKAKKTLKCDSSPVLSKKDFEKYCLNCQDEIAKLLREKKLWFCFGCIHEEVNFRGERLNHPSAESSCMLCRRNLEIDEWYESAKRSIQMPKKWDLVNIFLRINYAIKITRLRWILWHKYRKSKRKDMYIPFDVYMEKTHARCCDKIA